MSTHPAPLHPLGQIAVGSPSSPYYPTILQSCLQLAIHEVVSGPIPRHEDYGQARLYCGTAQAWPELRRYTGNRYR